MSQDGRYMFEIFGLEPESEYAIDEESTCRLCGSLFSDWTENGDVVYDCGTIKLVGDGRTSLLFDVSIKCSNRQAESEDDGSPPEQKFNKGHKLSDFVPGVWGRIWTKDIHISSVTEKEDGTWL